MQPPFLESLPCNRFGSFPQDLKGTLAQELDFEIEARNSERCAQELARFHFVVIPRVYWEKSSKVCLMNSALF